MFIQHNTTFVAHRGLSPENTCAAFKKAYALGFAVAECDVHVTKDQKIVVCHDDTLARTAICGDKPLLETPITQLTYAALKTVRVGDAHQREPVPLLSDVLDIMPDGCVLLVEIKHCEADRLQALLALLGAHLEKVIVISFNFELLSKVKQALPQCRTIFLTVSKDWGPGSTLVNDVESLMQALDMIAASGLDGISFEFGDFISADFVSHVPKHFMTHLWYVEQDVQKARQMVAACVQAGIGYVNVDAVSVLPSRI